MNGVFFKTTNASESVNSAYNKFCRHGIRSTNIVAENIGDFKLKLLNKRELIEHHVEIKMNKVRNEVLDRQAQIKTCLDSISFMDLQSEIDGLPHSLLNSPLTKSHRSLFISQKFLINCACDFSATKF